GAVGVRVGGGGEGGRGGGGRGGGARAGGGEGGGDEREEAASGGGHLPPIVADGALAAAGRTVRADERSPDARDLGDGRRGRGRVRGRLRRRGLPAHRLERGRRGGVVGDPGRHRRPCLARGPAHTPCRRPRRGP